MKKFLKSFLYFFLTVYIYESFPKFKKIYIKKKSYFCIKSLNNIKKSKILEKYFIKYNFKRDRFKKKSKFIGLKNKNGIICSGWSYYGNEWKIDEINKKIKLKKKILLYDFQTDKKFRDKGYYKLLLKIIQNKFNGKKLIIYSLSNNKKSISAIKGAGFKLVKKLKRY